MEAKMYRTKYERSPRPKGGLEIVLQVTFKIVNGKRYLSRLIDLIKENYETQNLEVNESTCVTNVANSNECCGHTTLI